jgi:peptide/nickel transport system substrate-binding protein
MLNGVIEGDPPSLDLHQVETYQAVYPVAPAVNLLVQFDPQDHTRVIPDLAQQWDISPDNKTYTFHLVQNAKFHHGKPLRSEDVKASFDRIINPPQGVLSPRKESFATVDGVEAPDDFTVRFVLKRATPSLLVNIAQGWNAIYPKDILDAKGGMKSDLIGTGPFKLKNYQRGTSVELVKNPEYHVAGRPYLDGITYYIIPDANTVFSAFVNGQLLVWRYSVKPDVDELKRQLGDKFRITKVVDQSTHVMELNAKRKPWDDPRIRQAVSLAIDRQAAVSLVTKGEGVATGVMAPGGQWSLSSDDLVKLPGYGSNKADDLARAKQLLAEAGFPNGGLKITLLTRKGPQYEPVSVFLKDQLTGSAWTRTWMCARPRPTSTHSTGASSTVWERATRPPSTIQMPSSDSRGSAPRAATTPRSATRRSTICTSISQRWSTWANARCWSSNWRRRR